MDKLRSVLCLTKPSFSNIFPELQQDDPVDIFECAIQRETEISGQIFAAKHHFCFHSEFFQSEIKICVLWQHCWFKRDGNSIQLTLSEDRQTYIRCNSARFSPYMEELLKIDETFLLSTTDCQQALKIFEKRQAGSKTNFIGNASVRTPAIWQNQRYLSCNNLSTVPESQQCCDTNRDMALQNKIAELKKNLKINKALMQRLLSPVSQQDCATEFRSACAAYCFRAQAALRKLQRTPHVKENVQRIYECGQFIIKALEEIQTTLDDENVKKCFILILFKTNPPSPWSTIQQIEYRQVSGFEGTLEGYYCKKFREVLQYIEELYIQELS